MNRVGRIVVVACLALVTCAVSCGLSAASIRLQGHDVMSPFIAPACAVLVGWFVWKALRTRSTVGMLPTVVVRAAVVGGIGSVGGSFGPMILAPGANQGPLLGIFITGPLGLSFGGITGFFHALHKSPKNETLG